jgi:putative endonuclease
MFYLYILKSVNFNTYYIGISKNSEERFGQHNNGKVKATKSKRPWEKVYEEKFVTLSMASKREIYLKSLKKRSYIEKLIKHF